ncbi:MAG: beta-galactosidase [Pseudomonadota bacterium]
MITRLSRARDMVRATPSRTTDRRGFASALLLSGFIGFIALHSTSSAANTLNPPTPCFDGICAEPVVLPPKTSDPAPPPAGDPIVSGPGISDDDLSGGLQFKWNPGLYWGEKTDFIHLPTYDDVVERLWQGGNIGATAKATYLQEPWVQHVKGVRLKFHWAELEPEPNKFHWDVIDGYLDALAPTGQRVIVGVDHQANNNHAGTLSGAKENMCVPPDLRVQGEHMWWWTRKTGKNRCLARLWDPTSVARERYRTMCTALAERYGSHPRVEALFCKGENALGTPTDPTFVKEDHDAALRSIEAEVHSIGQGTMVLMPANGLGVKTEDIVRRAQTMFSIADDKPGFGFRKPDSYTRSTKAFPSTGFDRMYIGMNKHGQYPGVWDWQRPGDTYTDTEEHWRGAFGMDRYTHPQADVSSLLPVAPNNPNFSHGATHPVFIPNTTKDFATEDAWLAVFQANGWRPAYTDCPAAWVAAGASCVTGGL